MDGGAWWATVHGVTKSDTTSNFTFLSYQFITKAIVNYKLALAKSITNN